MPNVPARLGWVCMVCQREFGAGEPVQPYAIAPSGRALRSGVRVVSGYACLDHPHSESVDA